MRKECSKCKRTLPLNEFYKNKSKKDGLSYYCKDCHGKIRKEYYLKNRKKILEQMKEYREKNGDKIRKRQREYSKKNKDKKREYDKIYRAENWEKKRLADKRWRERNREIIRESKKIYNIEYRKTHVKEIRARAIAYKFPLGDKCEYCDTVENLQRHHPSYDYPEIFNTACQSCNIKQSLK